MVIPLTLHAGPRGISRFRNPIILVLPLFLSGSFPARAGVDIEASARATLEKNCLSCHGAARISGLDLREKAGMMRGGTRGPALTPGKAEDSILYQAAAHIGDLKMPPGKQQLSGEEIKNLKQWIDAGAPWTSLASAKHAAPSWWSFKTPIKPPVPKVVVTNWIANPIDAFVACKLDEKHLSHAPPADRRTLIRRAYFDLIGLPPSPEDVAKFVHDQSPDAYPKLIESLLNSEHYGERWARHWLDVARYSDSGGFETDIFYPNAWRYRDYVIKSFNEDKPYDRFVQEQIAGDELWPDNLDLHGTYQIAPLQLADLEAWIGTGLYTLGPELHESNMNIPKLVYEQLTDAADTTGGVFLGLTLGCARCHDHKFDPLPQRDYYRLQAIFAPSHPSDTPVVPRHYLADYRQNYTKLLVVNEARRAYELFDKKIRDRAAARVKTKYPKAVVDAFEIPEEKRSAAQQELAAPLAKEVKAIKLESVLTLEERQERDRLLERIAKAVLDLPAKDASQNIAFDGLMEVPAATVLAHYPPELTPAVHILGRGDMNREQDQVGPGVPGVLDDGTISFDQSKGPDTIAMNRRKLALWLTRPDNPLTARVIVNRVWMWHFGNGIVSTPNDFGRQGQMPSHPELLDWLATEFIESGWTIKELHRLIMLSDTYQQASTFRDEHNLNADPENRYLWRMNRLRLEGEGLWDAIHSVSGTLNLKMGGHPVVPALADDELSALGDPSKWPVAADPAEQQRRGIYILNRRNFSYPMLQAFDSPDNAVSCPERDVTTVAPQALWLMNNNVAFEQAQQFAGRLVKERGDDPAAWIERAWRLALGRAPTDLERKKALAMLDALTKTSALGSLPHDLPESLAVLPPPRAAALSKLCLMLFSLQEFTYVD
jgi:hypothetical protein